MTDLYNRKRVVGRAVGLAIMGICALPLCAIFSASPECTLEVVVHISCCSARSCWQDELTDYNTCAIMALPLRPDLQIQANKYAIPSPLSVSLLGAMWDSLFMWHVSVCQL